LPAKIDIFADMPLQHLLLLIREDFRVKTATAFFKKPPHRLSIPSTWLGIPPKRASA
jgi:hypothetical protein